MYMYLPVIELQQMLFPASQYDTIFSSNSQRAVYSDLQDSDTSDAIFVVSLEADLNFSAWNKHLYMAIKHSIMKQVLVIPGTSISF